MEAVAEAVERDVMEAVEVATAQLITTAVTQAHDNGESCNIGLIACASTDMCARSNMPCRGGDVDRVVPCCQPDDVCIRRTETVSICRARDLPPPSFWVGGEDMARVCPEEVPM